MFTVFTGMIYSKHPLERNHVCCVQVKSLFSSEFVKSGQSIYKIIEGQCCFLPDNGILLIQNSIVEDIYGTWHIQFFIISMYIIIITWEDSKHHFLLIWSINLFHTAAMIDQNKARTFLILRILCPITWATNSKATYHSFVTYRQHKSPISVCTLYPCKPQHTEPDLFHQALRRSCNDTSQTPVAKSWFSVLAFLQSIKNRLKIGNPLP